jgi:hypothetical protein
MVFTFQTSHFQASGLLVYLPVQQSLKNNIAHLPAAEKRKLPKRLVHIGGKPEEKVLFICVFHDVKTSITQVIPLPPNKKRLATASGPAGPSAV